MPGKMETQQASASRTVPPFLRNRERFYNPLEGLMFFILLLSIKTATAGIRQQPGLVFMKLLAPTFFLKCRMLQRESMGLLEYKVEIHYLALYEKCLVTPT